MTFYRVVFIYLVLTFGSAFAETTGIEDAKISVYFAPDDQCTSAVVKALDAAKSSIRIMAYNFSSPPIAKAVVDAQKRGLSVEVILDKTNRTSNYSVADFLLHADIATRIDTGHAKAHNKIMVIDDRIVITGSFNFTSSAESKNAENLLIIESPKLAASYLENYRKLRGASEVYKGKGQKTENLPLDAEK